MTSEKQILANRNNALHSTGPRTIEGKSRVRLNALTTGLQAKDIVVTTAAGHETIEEYEEFRESLYEALQPEGAAEEIVAEQTVSAAWHLRRAQRAERGKLQRATDSAIDRILRDREEAFLRDRAIVEAGPDADLDALMARITRPGTLIEFDRARRRLAASAAGLAYMAGLVRGAILELLNAGQLSENTEQRLKYLFEHEDGGAMKDLSGLLHNISDAHSALQSEATRLEERRVQAEEREARELEAVVVSMVVPDESVGVSILRHETTYEKQYYKALAELERLKRASRGDPAPPTIDLKLSS